MRKRHFHKAAAQAQVRNLRSNHGLPSQVQFRRGGAPHAGAFGAGPFRQNRAKILRVSRKLAGGLEGGNTHRDQWVNNS